MKRVLFVGHGRAGKDTACERFAAATGLRNAGTVSLYLTPHVARRLGVPEEQAYAERHANRAFWRAVGDELRAADPSILVREMFGHGDVGGGVRGLSEIRAVRREGLADLVVWVGNCRVPADPTLEFSADECDVTMPNHGTLAEFHARIDRLAAFSGFRLVMGLADRVAGQSALLSERAERTGGA